MGCIVTTVFKLYVENIWCTFNLFHFNFCKQKQFATEFRKTTILISVNNFIVLFQKHVFLK